MTAMVCDDWRNVSAEDMAPWLRAEEARWRQQLGWETEETWRAVDAARLEGRLAGFVVREGRRIIGWAFYVVQGSTVEVGTLVAEEARGIRRLIDELLQVPEAQQADRISLFLLSDLGPLSAALTRRRFQLQVHDYLGLALTDRATDEPPLPSGVTLRPLRAADEPWVVRLLADGYKGVPAAECFAPHGRLDEWAWHARQLLRTSACGTLLPEATLVAEGAHREGLTGFVLSTEIAPRTAHIAQIVVAPDMRGAGLGRCLIHHASTRARDHGAERLTLMVSQDNVRARHVYEAAGFVAGPTFLYAGRLLPRRLARAS